MSARLVRYSGDELYRGSIVMLAPDGSPAWIGESHVRFCPGTRVRAWANEGPRLPQNRIIGIIIAVDHRDRTFLVLWPR